MPRFSVVIPCFRDEEKLTDLLCQLQNLPITSGCRLLEVIVVDGASTLKCCEVCNRYGAYWVPMEPCRGQQLTAGAAFARGDALWFLHADARLPENPLAAMNRAFEQGAIGGYFSFRFGAPRAWPHYCLSPLSLCAAGSVFPTAIKGYLWPGVRTSRLAAIRPGLCSKRWRLFAGCEVPGVSLL